MDEYKQYIKTKVIGTNTLVVDGYADWQTEKYDPVDMQLSGIFPRQFQIQLISPSPRSQYLYKLINGAMVARTQEELDVEYNARPPLPPSTESRLAAAEAALISLMGL